MKIKKYTGATAYEAMTKLKNELGQDAIVLNTRTVRQKGFFGFFKKPIVEITAAFEKKQSVPSKLNMDAKWMEISDEIQDIKNMIENFSPNSREETEKLPNNIDNYRMILVNKGVEYNIATSIIKEINQQIDLSNKSEEFIEDIIKYSLMEYIGDIKPISASLGHPKVVFFIGPTGVGKTTTLAKIASQLVLEKKYDIGLITTDTYRIAAVEQLKIYSNILNLPLKIAYSESDLFNSLRGFSEKDVVLIDTAGRNHRDIDKEDPVYKVLNTINNKEIFLVLSGTTDYITLKSIINHYDIIDNYKIIFTKMDEAQGLGNIINAKFLSTKPLSYITMGQNVPDDIEILNKDKVVNSLIGENIYGRSS